MQHRDELAHILHRLKQTEESIRATQAIDAGLARRTQRLLQIVFLLIGLVALVNLYFVSDLAQETQIIIRNMTTMYEQFGEMSERMSGMRTHVSAMGQNIALMPVMVDQMDMISRNMLSMEHDVSGMRTHMQHLTGHVHVMYQDIHTMNLLFRDVNGKLVHMRYYVGHMSNVVP
ncbi:hypothetical protein [Thiorhodospira sibirica]|uniref:hypothetical protein n=1 Tax=Thiorhodospira sibirica TaxID=154347 RepID=UPI00022C4037|nr:hypothetical protein [Thiorhodospira sibirica]